MSKYYYQALGYDRQNGDFYMLCFTSNKNRAKQYYREGGWKEEDLLFIKKEVTK